MILDRSLGIVKLQLTPPCGGEPRRTCREMFPNCFNSRPRVGANNLVCSVYCVYICFNSRPRVGANRNQRTKVFMLSTLQLTPPCGGERPEHITYAGHYDDKLQLTPPCGGELNGLFGGTYHKALQLTPPCGGEQQNCTNSNSPNKNITERLTTSLLFALRRSIQSITFLRNYRFLRCEPNWKFCELQVRTD